jgi:hypothetical protein
MDIQHWHAEWTCKMDVRDDQAAWKNSIDMQHGDIDMQHGQAAWVCQGKAARIYSVDMQHVHMYMKHKKQHGHGA